MKLDYGKLTPGCIIGTTNMLSPVSAMIRGVSAGWRHCMDARVSSHVLGVVMEHDLLYGIEMNPPKIRQVDLCDIGRITFIAKPVNIDQAKANWWLLKAHAQCIKYDFEGLLEFIPELKINDNKNRYYCSELIREMLRWSQYRGMPLAWDEKVSPYDMQTWFTNHKELI